MADWTASMSQSYEYYTVDPGTWKNVKRLMNVTACSITWDWESDTLGSASLDTDEIFEETYVRIYLVTIQNGVTERHPLGCFLVQSPSSTFDGKRTTGTMDCYTPLIELKENQPPLGFFVEEGANIMETAARLTAEHLRAPVVAAVSDKTMYKDFVSNGEDTWMTFLSDLAISANFYHDLDEMGRVLFAPKQDVASLQPVWTYTDDNSSILYPEISVDRDLYGIPNVVEVVYSDEHSLYISRAVNDDENSPISTVRRGREIVSRITNPEFSGIPTQAMVDEYAEQQLRSVSTLEFTISYKHGYNGVRIGDCVRLNYRKANITDIKARVINQTIQCTESCTVSEKATFTSKLWR